MSKTLVCGIGNVLLTDDGIGVRLVNDLVIGFDHPGLFFTTVTVIDPFFLDVVKGYDTLILIDAIKKPDTNPGEIFLLPVDRYRLTMHLHNYHDFKLPELISCGKQLGYEDLPEEVRIIAVQVYKTDTFGEDLSEEMHRRYPSILEKVAQTLKKNVAPKILHESHEII